MTLELENVHFGYEAVPVLRGVTLRLEAGESVALLGANGAGKTTLVRLAMGLLHPSSGRVCSAGRDTRGRHPEDLADAVGYLFQRPEDQLFERTVQAEVAFGPRQWGWPSDQIVGAVAEVLDELSLSSVATVHPHDLPAPQRRLVALAGVLVGRPKLLLLDEPTAGLERPSRRLVQRVVRRRAEAGVAVLAITHDTEFAAEALQRAVILAEGRIGRDTDVARLLREEAASLPLPPTMRLAQGLGLAPAVYRFDEVVRAVSQRCRGVGPPLS